MPLDGGEPKLLPIPQGLIFEEIIRDNKGGPWQPTPGEITLISREAATSATVVLRINWLLDRTTTVWKGHARFDVTGIRGKSSLLLGTFEDSNTPQDVFIFDTDFSRRQRLSQVEPRLSGITLGRAEFFATPVRRFDGGGTSVTSSILLPPGAKRGDRLPALVFVYPRGNYSVITADEYGGGLPGTLPAAVFTTRGYAVLLTDAPVRPLDEAGNLVSDLVDVILPQVEHAAALGYIDISRVAVSGQSFGGYSTAALLSATSVFRAGVAVAGVYDLTYLSSYMGKDGGFGYPPRIIQSYWNLRGHPWEDLPGYLDASPYFRAKRIHAPLLLIHGDRDEIAPIEDARKMFNALRRLGRTAQLSEYAGEGHIPTEWDVANAADAARRAVEFLDKYVKRAPSSVSPSGGARTGHGQSSGASRHAVE